MQDKPAESKALPHTVVFITAGVWPQWPACDFTSLNGFLDDMDALGFAIWRTPGTVFIFTGEAA